MKKYVIIAFFFTLRLGLDAAINIVGYDTLTNDRFSNDPSFVAEPFDLSGVGYNGTGPSSSGWLTMISPNVYITAEHAKPALGSSATFYSSNDPNGSTLTRSVTSNRQQIGTTDIFVGTLDAALSSAFTYYDFATETITNAAGGPSSFGASPYSGANAYAFGLSPSTWPTSQNMAVGRNILDRFQAGITVSGANGGDYIGADVGGDNAVDFEAQLAVGDSGGPLMVENASGGLTIVGVNWFVSNDNTYFGASYLGNYSDEIQTFIDANPVPEPSYGALLLGLLGLVAALRRRGIAD